MSVAWDVETKEGWRAWVSRQDPVLPERWTRERSERASRSDRDAYNDARSVYHESFVPVVHERARAALEEMMRQLRRNRHATQLPLISLVLDGDSTLGKTTLLMMLGWLYESKYASPAERAGDDASTPLADVTPVVLITLESDASVASINESILRFLGAPLPPRGRMRDLTEPLVRAVRAAGVKVLLIDELSNLKKRYIRHDVVNDHLKWMMNRLPATLVFAGVDCADTTLLGRKQTSWRVHWTRVEPFSLTDDDGKREWQKLLEHLERRFILLDAPPRMLSGSAEMRTYLHRRSRGSIGVLLDLLRSAADEAIGSGHERIDREILERQRLSFGAAQPPPNGAAGAGRGGRMRQPAAGAG